MSPIPCRRCGSRAASGSFQALAKECVGRRRTVTGKVDEDARVNRLDTDRLLASITADVAVALADRGPARTWAPWDLKSPISYEAHEVLGGKGRGLTPHTSERPFGRALCPRAFRVVGDHAYNTADR